MTVIIEGPDNSGKSTLAQHIAAPNQLIQESEGPPKWPGEIVERISRYFAFPDDTIFVRHPAISNPIYDHTRPEHLRDPIPTMVLAEFYDLQSLMIYCDPVDRTMAGHEVKGVDSDDHIRRITDHRDVITQLYRAWACRHAHVVYRIGDDMEFIKSIVGHWRIVQAAHSNAEFIQPLLESKT